MVQSLLIKLAMLAMTMGAVFWIGWQAPQAPMKNQSVIAGAESMALSAPAPIGPSKSGPGQSDTQPRDAQTSRAAKSMRAQVLSHGVLDLNRATAEELESLPGIGPVLAQRVVAYRKSVGKFQAVDELREVKGIGVKKFGRIKPLVTVASSGSKGKTEKHPL